MACGLQRGFQRVEDLGAHAQGFGEVRRADRRDHELLDVDRIVGMRAAVEDVHHRHRQQRRLRAAEIAVERLAAVARCRLGGGERHAENGVGAEPLLVLGAVEIAEALVDGALVARIRAGQRLADLAVHRLHGAFHALAAIALAAVAKLMRLMRAGRGA
jgi:hypothetical protein